MAKGLVGGLYPTNEGGLEDALLVFSLCEFCEYLAYSKRAQMVRFSHDLLSIKSVTSPPKEPILGDFMKYLRNISSPTLRGGGLFCTIREGKLSWVETYLIPLLLFFWTTHWLCQGLLYEHIFIAQCK